MISCAPGTRALRRASFDTRRGRPIWAASCKGKNSWKSGWSFDARSKGQPGYSLAGEIDDL